MSASQLPLYAEALVSLSEASGQIARIEKELLDLLDLLKNSRDLRNFLGDLTIAHKGKTAALEELLDGRLHPVLVHFILLLQAENALGDIDTIASEFFARASARRSKAAGLLIASSPISDEVRTRIEQEVGRILGKTVHLLVRMDTSLLGGMRVQVGDFVVDGTVDRQLEEMRARLSA